MRECRVGVRRLRPVDFEESNPCMCDRMDHHELPEARFRAAAGSDRHPHECATSEHEKLSDTRSVENSAAIRARVEAGRSRRVAHPITLPCRGSAIPAKGGVAAVIFGAIATVRTTGSQQLPWYADLEAITQEWREL